MNVVFILGSSVNQNGIKRIDEFCSRGYNVSAYGFHRKMTIENHPKDVKMTIVGEFTNDIPYRKRIRIIASGLRTVLQQTDSDNSIYYLIGSDVGLFFSLLYRRKKYIYEEADLVHTYINNPIFRNLLRILDKRVISKSVMTVFRSEGFIRYYFGDTCPDNVTFIANRLDPSVLDCEEMVKKTVSCEHLRFGFVGAIRFQSIFNFARVLLENFPQHEFHFYGSAFSSQDETMFRDLVRYKNCFFYGTFSNPKDLPAIYRNIDLLLSTYDVAYDNVKYAEPNKIYEAIYFETPIIVSIGTFLSEKTEKLGIGYSIDPLDSKKIIEFINGLSEQDIMRKVGNIKSIDKTYALNINNEFFIKFNKLTGIL